MARKTTPSIRPSIWIWHLEFWTLNCNMLSGGHWEAKLVSFDPPGRRNLNLRLRERSVVQRPPGRGHPNNRTGADRPNQTNGSGSASCPLRSIALSGRNRNWFPHKNGEWVGPGRRGRRRRFGDEMRLGLQEKRLRLSFCHITTFLPTSTDPCFLSNRRFSLASCGIFIHFPAHSDALFSDSNFASR